MLLRQLEYLVALARERHFARAAAACFVSQPSLSAAIRKLEQELDVPIVLRGHRFEGLTPEGTRVLRWAHRILAERDALCQELSEMRGGLTGTLRLGAIPTALSAAPLLTTPFCERHPLARVSLESLSSTEIGHRLADFELDVALTYLDDESLRDVRRLVLYRERYLLLTPDDGLPRGPARWAEIARLPLCLLSPHMRNRRIMDAFFAAEGATATPAVETDSVAGLYAHLTGGRWSSVIAHAWLHMFGVPEGMRVVPVECPAHGPRVGLAIADRVPASVLGRALLDVARGTRIHDTLDALLNEHLAPAPAAAAPDSPLLSPHREERFDPRPLTRGP
ncbi:LysR family transcriptional regulator [Streptomyces radicis]|uniref:LysR family transcriptional regulator n=1 Tax=Streptomyces radicis TaxID=1750517 RepID=A0A3A9VWR5_9ACTN|nr:LysR family transcriptional regulator [Streptomyces radicis]RKN04952.1 LysR family transcriptional regulator [Streptomyces radicis]RKN16345.1 LysR family transcriptional regulator [Streptomyces radicis]